MQTADWLNYHHLYYFWMVAREGSLSAAARELRLSHSTLSTQIRALESFLGGELFVRSGRALSLTVLGQDVLRYADEIFRLGVELVDMTAGQTAPVKSALRIGIVDGIPQNIAYRFAEPVLRLDARAPISFAQGKLTHLLQDLSAGKLHLILSDQPPPQGLLVHVFCRPLGETSISLCGTAELLRKHSESFPRSLRGAPVLLPTRAQDLRGQLDRWFAEQDIEVQVVGECDDPAMLRMLGLAGHGLFPLRTSLAAELVAGEGASVLGELAGVRERFYAISVERRQTRLDAKLLIEESRERLFAASGRNRHGR